MDMQTQQEPRILLVEDNPLTREALTYILEVEGYCVATAEDGQQGLKLLHSIPHPFVVLLDLGLPIINGHEFLRRQKQDPDVADVPVFVITAEFEPSIPDATAVFRKPLDLPKLMGLLSGCRHQERTTEAGDE
jgi:CheY-like chemotaxis protein